MICEIQANNPKIRTIPYTMSNRSQTGQENLYFEMEHRIWSWNLWRHRYMSNSPGRLHTLKFRRLFVAESVISVASLLKAVATLVLASAMMMVRSDASTYDKWKLEVINLWLEILKLLIISSMMLFIGYDLHFLWSTIYLTFG